MAPKSGSGRCRHEFPNPVSDDRYTLWRLFGVLVPDWCRGPLGTPRVGPQGTSRDPPRHPRDPPEASQNAPRTLPACRILTVSSEIQSRILPESFQNHWNPYRIFRTCQNPFRILSESFQNPHRILPESFQNPTRIIRILPEEASQNPLQNPIRILRIRIES